MELNGFEMHYVRFRVSLRDPNDYCMCALKIAKEASSHCHRESQQQRTRAKGRT